MGNSMTVTRFVYVIKIKEAELQPGLVLNFFVFFLLYESLVSLTTITVQSILGIFDLD